LRVSATAAGRNTVRASESRVYYAVSRNEWISVNYDESGANQLTASARGFAAGVVDVSPRLRAGVELVDRISGNSNLANWRNQAIENAPIAANFGRLAGGVVQAERVSHEVPFVPEFDPVPRGEAYGRFAAMAGAALNAGPISAIRGNSHASWARDTASRFAEISDFRNPLFTGECDEPEFKTWDNEADAMRHFLWNARMTRQLGNDTAQSIANHRESLDWARVDIEGGQAVRIGFDSLMDLYNDHMGRVYAQRYPNLSEFELFVKAISNGDVITSPYDVQNFFGLRNRHLFSCPEGGRYVLVFEPDARRQPIRFSSDASTRPRARYMTYAEFNRRNDNQ